MQRGAAAESDQSALGDIGSFFHRMYPGSAGHVLIDNLNNGLGGSMGIVIKRGLS